MRDPAQRGIRSHVPSEPDSHYTGQHEAQMKNNVKYSIGDVSRICNISKKALRYYDDINIISSQRQEYNNYRYYTHDALLAVPVIKYYKQMGFKLDEMRSFIEEREISCVYRELKATFRGKIEELELLQEHIGRQYVSIKDWYDLIAEAEMVIENGIREVSIKYVDAAEYLFQEQTYEADLKSAIINIDWTNYVNSLSNEVTGPIILNFTSRDRRMRDESQPMRILQKTLKPASANTRMPFGGGMMASCYHIGPHHTIRETYARLCRWADRHGYLLAGETFERYVTDYWTTRNDAQFVTEILITASRHKAT